ncbi:MAG TPA: hypothetical protein VGX27_03430 [Candidatus Dormibacteraeota bacterium]|nr:hypothetical protein [Candidatus Dormibacteraeota bacterium]
MADHCEASESTSLYRCTPSPPSIANAITPMTALAASQAQKMRRRPATRRQRGTSNASWGLRTMRLSSRPLRTGRLCSASHHDVATTAATSATG